MSVAYQFTVLTGILLIGAEELVYLVTNFTIGNLDIVLGIARVVHEVKEPILADVELYVVSILCFYSLPLRNSRVGTQFS